jgi:hypothetical protein
LAQKFVQITLVLSVKKEDSEQIVNELEMSLDLIGIESDIFDDDISTKELDRVPDEWEEDMY